MSAASFNIPKQLFALSLALCLGLSALMVISSAAEARKYKRHSNYDHIRIESRFSPNKYIIAAIRPAYDGGTEVQLPSGSWVHCASNCRWTVQKEYLDFWEFQQNPFGPGYFRIERHFD